MLNPATVTKPFLRPPGRHALYDRHGYHLADDPWSVW